VGQLTRVGQKLEQHQGGLFPFVSGSPSDKNALGNEVLQAILYNPESMVRPITSGNFVGGFRIVDPLGRGATFDANRVFQYFGEFP